MWTLLVELDSQPDDDARSSGGTGANQRSLPADAGLYGRRVVCRKASKFLMLPLRRRIACAGPAGFA